MSEAVTARRAVADRGVVLDEAGVCEDREALGAVLSVDCDDLDLTGPEPCLGGEEGHHGALVAGLGLGRGVAQ